MCGRYADYLDLEDFEYLFGFSPKEFEFKKRYNIAPSTFVTTVREDEDGDREAARLKWGLVPFWAKDAKIGYKMINARSETAAEKPSFRAAFKARRCLIPCSGFYEWKRAGTVKTPYYIHPRDAPAMAFAGLWERNQQVSGPEEEPLETVTILTNKPNATMEPIHDRMPVILAREDFDTWLHTPEKEAGDLKKLLRPAPDGLLAAHPVSTRVNSPRNEGAELVEAV